MNYIKHLNTVLQQFSKDSRLNPTHISLYIALFQLWNIGRFRDVFFINRAEVMDMAKLGSKSTYHRCLKELDHWKYVKYLPSYNPYKGSRIKMLEFGTGSFTSNRAGSEQVVVKALVPFININKQNKNNNKLKLPKNENEVLDFFKKQNWSALEAEKFFNHYSSIGWKVGGKIEMVDWHSTAKNWILKADEIKKGRTIYTPSQKQDNLHTTKNKDYGQPL